MRSKLRSVGIATLAISIVVALRVAITGRVSMVGIDDANIYFTFVKNILAGHGIVFDPAGPAVEGFTSVGWLGLLTFAQALSPFSLDITSLALCAMVAITLLAFIHDRLSAHAPLLALPAVVMVVLLPGAADWLVLSRMETGLWALLVVVATWWSVMQPQRHLWLIVVLSLLPLVRPEGYALAPLLALLVALRTQPPGPLPGRLGFIVGRTLKLAFGPLLVVGIILLWRLETFGVPLPMTYYAKVSASPIDNLTDGLAYLIRSVSTGGWVPLVAVCIALFGNRRRVPTQWMTVALAWLVLQPILSGGDHFHYARFLFPAFALCWMTVAALSGQRALQRKHIWFATVALVALQLGASVVPPWQNALKHEYKIASDGRMESDLVMAVHSGRAMPLWGVTSAGGTSFQYSGSCLDLLGLNNSDMAMADPTKRGAMRNHGSFSADVFFRQQPDILVVFGAPSDSAAQLHFDEDWAPDGIQRLLLRGLLEDPRMERLYCAAKISRGSTAYYALVRTQWTTTLPEDISVAPFQINTVQEPDIP